MSPALKSATRAELAAIVARLPDDLVESLLFDGRAQDALADMRRLADATQAAVGTPEFGPLSLQFDRANRRYDSAYAAYLKVANRRIVPG